MEIKLSQGKVTYINKEDYHLICDSNWHAQKSSNKKYHYVVAHKWKNGKRTTIRMHRIILGAKDNEEVDHIDGDALNNRRENLRIATRSQNCQNRKYVNASGYTGVYWKEKLNKYEAAIKINGKRKSLGCYSDNKMAALAYNKAAKKYYGNFAKLNKI